MKNSEKFIVLFLVSTFVRRLEVRTEVRVVNWNVFKMTLTLLYIYWLIAGPGVSSTNACLWQELQLYNWYFPVGRNVFKLLYYYFPDTLEQQSWAISVPPTARLAAWKSAFIDMTTIIIIDNYKLSYWQHSQDIKYWQGRHSSPWQVYKKQRQQSGSVWELISGTSCRSLFFFAAVTVRALRGAIITK